jgi:peroxiredoxin
MLAVSVDADPQVVTPFTEERKFTFTVGLDPKMELANTYNVRGLPASFVVDRQGHLTALALGPREWDSAAGRALIEGLTR